MYSQSFLVSSVRGSGSLPTTAASAASGCTGLLRAFLGEAAFFGVGIGQLERAGLGSQAKNQPCFSGSRERLGESQPIVLGLLIRKLISFGNTHDPTIGCFKTLIWKNLGEARGVGAEEHGLKDVKGFITRKPLWLAANLPVAMIRRGGGNDGGRARNFSQVAIAQTSDAGVRQLLGDLASEESKHYDLAEKMDEKQKASGLALRWAPSGSTCVTVITRNTRRVRIWFSSAFPLKNIFKLCLARFYG